MLALSQNVRKSNCGRSSELLHSSRYYSNNSKTKSQVYVITMESRLERGVCTHTTFFFFVRMCQHHVQS